jgi:RNA polymerase sigma-B factor
VRFVDERTQAEIGAVIGVSQLQIARFAVLDRLRETLLEADCAA